MDASAFFDRFKAMARICGPQAWPSLVAPRAEIERAMGVVDGRIPADSAQDLERAHYLVDTSVHPDTKKILPLPFRMAAHVPANTVLLVMMLSSKSALATAGSQLANQSFNAMQFWSNRNGSNDVDTAVFAASFVGSVAASVGVGVALRRWEARAAGRLGRRGGRLAWLAAQCIPLIAAGAAKPLQIGVMRQDELRTGVAVNLPSGRPVLGTDGSPVRSATAGRTAVATTVASRVLYLVPPMVVPPLAMAALAPALAGAPAAVSAAVFVLLCGSLSAITTPVCMALWERQMRLDIRAFEPAVRASAVRSAGDDEPSPEWLSFNKGL